MSIPDQAGFEAAHQLVRHQQSLPVGVSLGARGPGALDASTCRCHARLWAAEGASASDGRDSPAGLGGSDPAIEDTCSLRSHRAFWDTVR